MSNGLHFVQKYYRNNTERRAVSLRSLGFLSFSGAPESKYRYDQCWASSEHGVTSTNSHLSDNRNHLHCLLDPIEYLTAAGERRDTVSGVCRHAALADRSGDLQFVRQPRHLRRHVAPFQKSSCRRAYMC